MISKTHLKAINGNMDQLVQWPKKEPKTHADLTMIQVYAKIGMIQVIAFLETAAFISMIGVTIKQDGNYRRISKNQSEKGGNASWTQILHNNQIT